MCFLGVMIKNSVNSDYLQEGDDSVGYAMVLQNYYTFDHSDKTNVAIKLSWDDGAVDLNGGTAEAKIKAKVYPINLPDKKLLGNRLMTISQRLTAAVI